MIDLLIIGSGGAGLSAALKAKEFSDKILVVSKTFPTHSQTCQAQGGINAVLRETIEDSVENYVNDTYKASHKLGNKKNIEHMCSNSKKTLEWLDSIGVPFSRDENNNIAQRKFGGTKTKRTCYSSDYTGLKILHTLYDQCIKNDINFLNEHLLLKLIVESNSVKGAIFLDILTSEIKQIEAKSVILATGGYAGIFHGFTTNSYATTADGIVNAYNSGAKLSNLEFIQFHPTSLENKNILISESARGEGGYLVDENGKRFIDELKPRDEVARAIYKKNLNKERVFLDLRHLGLEKINKAMPQERSLVFDFMNLKMEEDLIPVNPSAHYSMGGILADINTKTSIDNLYAIGECAQSGIHGANRLGGNSLLEIITFGLISGENAINNSLLNKNYKKPNENQYSLIKEDIKEIYKKENTKDFYAIKKELGKFLFNNVGLFREQKKLQDALDYVQLKKIELKEMGIEDKSKTYNRNLVDLLEFKNILIISELILKSAIERKESRGAHFRTDFNEEKNEFDKNTVVKLENEKIFISFEEIQ